MKSSILFNDIPLMGIRISLIKNNIWTARFENSRNPIVRAHATLKQYDLRQISVLELADGIMRDCIIRPYGGLNLAPLNVYKEWLSRNPLSENLRSNLSLAVDNERLAISSPRVVMAIFKIKQELGLF